MARKGSEGRWPVWRLALLVYVFAAAAVAINLFMLGLLAQSFGFTALSPVAALLLSGPLGFPAAWACGRWLRGLLDAGSEGPPAADASGPPG